MFTGIIEERAPVEMVQKRTRGITLAVRAHICGRGAKIGDSIAVNGCCLTITRIARARGSVQLFFDLLQETWERTNLQHVRGGSLVNLERSLPANGRIGGHFVTGHIDGVGTITRLKRKGADHVLDIQAPPEVLRYVVFKGSIAIDGISLTVAGLTKRGFRVWIIPHTFAATTLQARTKGDAVNLEADLLGKYVEQFLARRKRRP